MKVLLVLTLSLLFFQCGRRRVPEPPRPQPTPAPTIQPTPEVSPSPIVTPSPAIPIAWATPYPTPVFDPASYLPAPPVGKTVRVAQEGSEDYSAEIQAAQDDPDVASVVIGPGSLKRSVILRKHTKIETTPATPLACDLTEPLPQYAKLIAQTDYGCMLVADGVHVSGTYRAPKELIEAFEKGNLRNWATDPYFQKLDALTEEQIAGNSSTILEPTFISTNRQPQVSVFQALGDVLNSHTDRASNIAISGIVIKGRQALYDGGVRSTVQLGNCQKCTVQEMFLWATASIGITAGGSALERNKHADNVLFYRNIASQVPAANMASINTRHAIAVNNYVRKPGNLRLKNAQGLPAGGGICGFDQETNSPADHTAFVYVINNLIDFQGAFMNGAGNGICMQDPYSGANREEVVVANNVIIGGRGERSDSRYMSNGLFLLGLVRPKIVNNYIFRTGQNAIQAYNVAEGLVQDNDFEHTGGGGNPSVLLTGVRNTTLRRNYFRTRVGLAINADASAGERAGSCGNTYEDYRIDGVDRSGLIPRSLPCP